MSSAPNSSVEQVRAQLTAAHLEKFGARSDEWLTAAIDTTSSAVAILSSEAMGAYDSEPDFITGSSEKERSA